MNGHENTIAWAERSLANPNQHYSRELVEALLEALKGTPIDLSQVTRIDVVRPGTGVCEHWADSWTMTSLQDEGRTLKLYAHGKGRQALHERNTALGRDLVEALDRKPNAL